MGTTQQYIEAVQNEFKTGVAKEHSYRPALKNYIEALLNDVQAVNEPARQKCGAPDYVVSKILSGTSIDVGYIEAKDTGTNLDITEKSEQLTRYLESLDNLILTDYLEFRFYVNQEKVASVCVAEVIDGAIKPIPEAFEELESLLTNFTEYTGQTIKSPRVLAEMMAKKARLMRDVFYKAVCDKEVKTGLHDQLEAFRKILIHDMDEEQFADVYAQTIAYGLFTARLHDTTLEDFSRQEARDLIPRSNPFLRKLFDYVCGAEMDDRVVWIVDALCEVYRATDVGGILSNFNKNTGRNDPIVHFYETFLGEYDPKLRKSRGVWYTPEPVVNFIVRAIDETLQTHFKIPDGIMDTSKVIVEVDSQTTDKRTKTKKKKEIREVHRVQMLDIATGTGSFMAEVVKQIHQKFAGQQGMWSNYVEDHLLPRLHGFEVLMASYAMCHMKLDLLLTETGYKPSNPKTPPRLGAYLANSLEEHHPDADSLFASWLAHEANEASHIKRDMPVMVAFGNPPYSGESSNKGAWIMDLMKDYKQEPSGGKLNEKNSKWINDDYVKFIRLGEYYIEKNGEGVLAYITNNGYLDNPTFRGMRWHLLNTFDDIYVIDLHGSAKKKEVCDDGSPDQNVFDIMQGVSIILAIKTKCKKDSKSLGQIHHFDLKGDRKTKYDFLWGKNLKNIKFTKLKNKSPYYFYIPRDYTAEKKYKLGFSLKELFKVYGNGIVTKRDKLCIQHSKKSVENSLHDFLNDTEENVKHKYNIPSDVRDWRYDWAKRDIIDNFDLNKIIQINYRPFDKRHIFYTGNSRGFVGWPVKKIMHNYTTHSNIGIMAPKALCDQSFAHCFVTNIVSEAIFLSGTTGSNALNFPLYLYPEESSSGELKLTDINEVRKANLNEIIINEIAKRVGLAFLPDHEHENAGAKGTFTPLDLLDYIYAVLHSPTYRDTWVEFLKSDFPHIPYPDDQKRFWKLVALGGELRLVHLLEHPILSTPITKFDISGDNEVESLSFKESVKDPSLGNVYINSDQCFENVPKIAWEFYIGGYQPAQKWLKYRKGEKLNFDDIKHYSKIIVALTETHSLMQKIDNFITIDA